MTKKGSGGGKSGGKKQVPASGRPTTAAEVMGKGNKGRG
jgi:hypothetical protein